MSGGRAPAAGAARVTRRAAVFGVAALLLLSPALAGSYLDRVALLLHQAGRDSDYLRERLSDKELAEVIHQLAAARVSAATKMQVPKEVALAHPHVLLVLENYERAADAAVSGQAQRFLTYHLRAREELRVLLGVLKQLGWELPKA